MLPVFIDHLFASAGGPRPDSDAIAELQRGRCVSNPAGSGRAATPDIAHMGAVLPKHFKPFRLAK